MHHSLSFDLQHDHILTKITLSSAKTPKSTGASDTGLQTKIPLDMFQLYCSSVCMQNLWLKLLTTDI